MMAKLVSPEVFLIDLENSHLLFFYLHMPYFLCEYIFLIFIPHVKDSSHNSSGPHLYALLNFN